MKKRTLVFSLTQKLRGEMLVLLDLVFGLKSNIPRSSFYVKHMSTLKPKKKKKLRKLKSQSHWFNAVFGERRGGKGSKDQHSHIQVGQSYQKISHRQVPDLKLPKHSHIRLRITYCVFLRSINNDGEMKGTVYLK